MNRRDFEKHLREHGCVLHHRGGKHDVWITHERLRAHPFLAIAV